MTFASSFLLRWLAGGASVALYLYAGVLLPLAAILLSLNNGKGTSNVYRYSSFFKRFCNGSPDGQWVRLPVFWIAPLEPSATFVHRGNSISF